VEVLLLCVTKYRALKTYVLLN